MLLFEPHYSLFACPSRRGLEFVLAFCPNCRAPLNCCSFLIAQVFTPTVVVDGAATSLTTLVMSGNSAGWVRFSCAACVLFAPTLCAVLYSPLLLRVC